MYLYHAGFCLAEFTVMVLFFFLVGFSMYKELCSFSMSVVALMCMLSGW